jgi:uncharacterized protein GlcG (DUF336 family)
MAQVRRGSDVSAQLASELTRGARAQAERLGIAIATVVVDRGGHLVAAERMDGAAGCTFPLALAKAETAAATLAASSVWFSTTQPGQPDWGMNVVLGGRFTSMPGGIPVVIDGETVGAIGVSGGEAAQDVSCAQAALEAAGIATSA